MARTTPKRKTSSVSKRSTPAPAQRSRPAARKVPAGVPKVVTKKPATSRTPGVEKAKTKRRSASASPKRKASAAPLKLTDGRPAESPATLIPYLTVRDAEASIACYRDAFGFELHGPVMRDSQGRVTHVGMRLGNAVIMFAPEHAANTMRSPAESGAPDSLTLYVYVPDIDRFAEQAMQAGVKLVQSPETQFWGDRIAIFKDPDGYHWTFATHVAPFDPPRAPGS